MQPVIIYLVKMALCSGLLLLYFFLFLRHRRIHSFNRLFLLTTAAASLIIPILHFQIPGNPAPDISQYVGQLAEITVTPNNQPPTATINWIFISYLIVCAVIGSRILFALHRIRKLKRQSRFQQLGRAKIYFTAAPNTPFTFMNSIFWNAKQDHQPDLKNNILRHEYYHVLRKHSLDIMFVEAAIAFFWVNPFFYIIRRELSLLHEFEADEYAVSGQTAEQYAELLVSDAIQRKMLPPVALHFYHPPFKQRLMMLLRPPQPTRFTIFRKLMLAPLLLGLLVTMAFTNVPISGPEPHPHPHPHPNPHPHPQPDPAGQASFPGGVTAWLQYLNSTLKYPQVAQDKEIKGKVVTRFNVSETGEVTDVHVISGPTEGGLREEAMRMIKASGNWIPAKKNGKPISSIKDQPILFMLEVQFTRKA